jgi:hypothetical protein
MVFCIHFELNYTHEANRYYPLTFGSFSPTVTLEYHLLINFVPLVNADFSIGSD